MDDLSKVLEKSHGVGKIFVINEDNLKNVVETLIPYNDYGHLKFYIKSYDDYEEEYFTKHKEIIWNNSFTKKEKENYRKQRDDLRDSYEEYQNKWMIENFEKLKEMLEGRIVIEGENDNSIPYEIFDILENKFNCQRYHLG